ncbi:FkbM family methyltransferase [Mariniblastus sp.]|nr:FkbM family methyltransferase [Mariniblastus sp.]
MEVGGHIGYLSIVFSSLIGDNGKLYVFEPGENNLAYTERNLNSLSNTSLIKKAVSNTNGTVELFLEDLTGQNNSIVENYHQFESNVKNSGVNDVQINSTTIPCITLDKFVQESIEGKISFIKIDIEGAELMALQGATDILRSHGPGLMVEITVGSREVFELLTSSGYKLFTPSGKKITDPEQISGNTFCWKTDNEIEKFLLDETRSHT